jgi:uncharacterized membrane protein YdjX (TVP38/TMEM64 family)
MSQLPGPGVTGSAIALRQALSLALLLAALIAVGYGLRSGILNGVLSPEWVDHEIRGSSVYGALVFTGVSTVAVVLLVPRHVVGFMGGYAFGAGAGTLLALAATELACALVFGIARSALQPLVRTRLGARVRKVEDFLIANPFAMTLLIRMLPWTSNLAVCAAAGASRVRAWPFLLGSLVGYLPLTFVMALAGSGVGAGAGPRVAAAVLGLAACIALSLWLVRRYRSEKALPIIG